MTHEKSDGGRGDGSISIRASRRRVRGAVAFGLIVILLLAGGIRTVIDVFSGVDFSFGYFNWFPIPLRVGLMSLAALAFLSGALILIQPLAMTIGWLPAFRAIETCGQYRLEVPSRIARWLRPQSLPISTGDVLDMRWQYSVDRGSKELGGSRLVAVLTLAVGESAVSCPVLARFSKTDLDPLRDWLTSRGIELHASI